MAKNVCWPYSSESGVRRCRTRTLGLRKGNISAEGYQLPAMYRFLLMRQPGRGVVCGRGMSGSGQPGIRVVPACVQSGNRRTNNRLAVLAFPCREQQGRTITHCSSLMSLVQPRSFCNNGSLLNLDDTVALPYNGDAESRLRGSAAPPTRNMMKTNGINSTGNGVANAMAADTHQGCTGGWLCRLSER